MKRSVKEKEEEDEILLKSRVDLHSVWAEIGWFSMFVSALIAVAATAYALIFHPKYQLKRAPLPHIEQRYVPSAMEQLSVRDSWSFVKNFIDFSPRVNETISFGHSNRGHYRLPRFFYESASFGLPSDDFALWSALSSLSLEPSFLLPWKYQFTSGISEEGIFISFPISAQSSNTTATDRLLSIQNGRIASDWHQAQSAVEKCARQANLSFILAWTPNHFGSRHEVDDLRHVHILQQIIPLRSGFQHLRFAAAAWADAPRFANISIPSSLSPHNSSSTIKRTTVAAEIDDSGEDPRAQSVVRV